MNSQTIVMCVVALILGMLLANMLKNVCGCKVVEGQCSDIYYVEDDNRYEFTEDCRSCVYAQRPEECGKLDLSDDCSIDINRISSEERYRRFKECGATPNILKQSKCCTEENVANDSPTEGCPRMFHSDKIIQDCGDAFYNSLPQDVKSKLD